MFLNIASVLKLVRSASVPAICHSRGYTFLYCRVQKQIWGNGTGGYTHKNTENHIKKTLFLIEKCFEDARQDEKHVPDLLESIIQPPGPVKDELRQKLSKIDQFGSQIKKIRVCTFQMSGKIRDSTNVAFEAVILSNPEPSFAIFGRASGQIFKKCGF